jgi:hypothetical protein
MKGTKCGDDDGVMVGVIEGVARGVGEGVSVGVGEGVGVGGFIMGATYAWLYCLFVN